MKAPRDIWKPMLRVRPVRNRAVRTESHGDHLRITVRKRRPRYLVPPLSWVIRPRLERQVELEGLGVEMLKMCDGHKRVEQLVDEFAATYDLTFHEARVSVTGYLKLLVQRGVIVLVDDQPADQKESA